MKSFLLEIITPQKKSFSEEVEMVTVPTPNGTIGVLKGHARLFTVITEGEIKIVTKTKDFYLAIGGGFMEVFDDKVSVLVSRAVHADELNEAEIEKATKNAKEVLSKAKDKSERESALALLQRSHLELQVLKRLHAKPSGAYGKH
jgi:F-type H+-transporting ATPase subunit epsilon